MSDVALIYPTGTNPVPVAECSPVRVGAKRVFVSTSYSYECTWTAKGIEVGALYSQPQPERYWRRSYAGVYAAEQVNGHLLCFLHGENKNELIAGVKHVNTVSGDQTCFSGYQPDGSYSDCWVDYYGFCSVMRDGKDLGPIVWPRAGYLYAGKQASCGIRHPSSIVHGGYVYLFYLDCSPGVGLAVARSPISALGAPGSFETWTGKDWASSLPANLHFDHPGPAAVGVLDNVLGYFAVTAIQSGFLGLEYSAWGSTVGTQRWESIDLIHWHKIGPVIYKSDDWGSSTVRFPRPSSERLALATGPTIKWVSL